MKAKQACPKCGGMMRTDAVGGFCPACWLSAALAPEVAMDDPESERATEMLPDEGGSPVAGALPEERGGGGLWRPPSLEAVRSLLPRFEIDAFLGRGGMGAVYKGLQPDLARSVAIKILPARMGADAQFVERFRREARILANLQHPGIVAVHEFGQTEEGHLFFVMEYVDGRDLAHVLRVAPLTPLQSLGIVTQVCEALQFAHGQGIIHRDIKPANLLITRDHRVKLVDFGLARPAREPAVQFTTAHAVMGTLDYMAPELRSGPADERTEIYALGVTLYETLTGVRPRGAFDPPSRKCPAEMDARLDAVVLKALQQEPSRRYAEVSEMKGELERIRATWTPVTPVSGERPREAVVSDSAPTLVAEGIAPADAAALVAPVTKERRARRKHSLKVRLRAMGCTLNLAIAFGLVAALGAVTLGIALFVPAASEVGHHGGAKAWPPPTPDDDNGFDFVASIVATAILSLICYGIWHRRPDHLRGRHVGTEDAPAPRREPQPASKVVEVPVAPPLGAPAKPPRRSVAMQVKGRGCTVKLALTFGVAACAWLSGYYYFGHPEHPQSYPTLGKLYKIDPARQHEVTEVGPPPPVSTIPGTPAPEATPRPWMADAIPLGPWEPKRWDMYTAGQAPAGRTFSLASVVVLAGQQQLDGGPQKGGPPYLTGEFRVTASGRGRAVLRSAQNPDQKLPRVILEYPLELRPPPEGTKLVRDDEHPLLITSVRRDAFGDVAIYTREIILP